MVTQKKIVAQLGQVVLGKNDIYYISIIFFIILNVRIPGGKKVDILSLGSLP